MANSKRTIPIKCNTDLSANYFDEFTARIIKNLTSYVGATNEYEDITEGQNVAMLKPLQSNELYAPIPLPEGINFCVGAKGFAQTNEIYVCVWNSNKNHLIYRINGNTRTGEIVKIDPCFNFQLDPRYFIHESAMWLEVLYLIDPDTNQKVIKKDLYWTDGYNYQGYLRTDDSIATNGFDASLFPYFSGNYPKCNLIRMGIPTPEDCMSITEIPRTDADAGLDNNRLYNTWQFRIRKTDVWGRPSEWGKVSDIDIPGINDCLGGSPSIPRCVELDFDAGDPTTNTIEIAYRNCNSTQWFRDNTLFLYNGNILGQWWLRSRNPDIIYNPNDNTIRYTFCRDKECDPIDVNETNRVENPLPNNSQVLFKLNKNIALANNEDGFNPFSLELKSKFTKTVIPPEQVDLGIRNITIYVPIYNQAQNYLTDLYPDGTNGYIYGNIGQARLYSQAFSNKKQSGFCGYLAGTGNVAISTQVYLQGGQLIDDPTNTGSYNKVSLQKFVFNNVQKGTYVFRIASQLIDPATDSNYQATSTPMWGVCPFDFNTFRTNENWNAPSGDFQNTNHICELVVDVCNGDYDTLNDNKILCILDVATSGEKVTCGYFYETKRNGFNQNPMELMNISFGNGMSSYITDHNGFYWFYTTGSGRTYGFGFYYKCALKYFDLHEGNVGITFSNFYLEEINNNQYSDFSVTPCNHILIKGRAVLIGTNIGVPNSNVILTRGGYGVTDDEGNFTIIAHDYVTKPQRNDSVVFVNSGCDYTQPDGSCVEIKNITIVPCTTCQNREIDLSDFVLFYPIIRSLLSGETYGLCAIQKDWLRRPSNAEDIGYVTIPSIIQSKTIGPSIIKINIDPTATFSTEVDHITFGITAGTTIAKYLSWIVDRVEFIDNTGNINTVAPTQIRIYYGSVIEYSKQHNYSTNTAWQFLVNNTSNPIIGDKVQFYINGDGTFYTKAIIGLVKYDQSGSYFLIDYTSDLQSLKSKALIRLIRPKECTGTEPYYEICNSRINIINGKAEKNEIILNVFDTYYLSRGIPIPAPVTPTPQVTQITTTVGQIATTVVPVAIPDVINLATFGFRFEHNSPSDLWGDGCWNVGRVYVKNPYESKIRRINQVALSGAASPNGQLNFLNYFDDNLKTDFNVNNTGGIYNVIVNLGGVTFITQFANFSVGYNDNIARTDGQGNVQVPSAANTWGNPMGKIEDTYGCQDVDKNSFRVRMGIAMFVDRNRGDLVQLNGTSAISMTDDLTEIVEGVKRGKHDAAFRAKIKSVLQNPSRYFVGAINPITNEYLLTDFSLSEPSYINSNRMYYSQLSETISFDIRTKDFRGWWSFTPEYYAYLDGDILNNNLFSFKNGQPYSHYNTNVNNSFNNFFGVQCEPVYEVIANTPLFKKKNYLNVSIYCKQTKFFSDKIITEAGQKSYLFLDNFKQALYFSFAPFLRDINTLKDVNKDATTNNNPFSEGDPLYGLWLSIRLIGDPAKLGQYFEILGVIIDSFDREKTG